jgi:GH15 family glucan-1,4-alpha-glucosidase
MLNYGIIGNCRTSALVSSEGSIDWFCFPNFDDPSAFAKILDEKKGGHFDITPVGDYRITQEYIKDTNVLETSFKGRGSAFRIIDFFPCYLEGEELKNIEELHRLLVIDKGKPNVRISFKPRLDYARGTTKVRTTKNSITAANGEQTLHLYSNLDLKGLGKKEVTLAEDLCFILSWGESKKSRSIESVQKELEKTTKYWRSYIGEAEVPNYQRDAVVRSILVLKLLTFNDSGGVVASSTASIPEVIGRGRNIDKRYCWVKDQSFAIDALTSVGLFEEAKGFMRFLTSIGAAYLMKEERYGFGMPSMYAPHGGSFLDEQVLEHLSGYRDSTPVVIGNDAHKLRQIGVFGELLDAIYKFFVTYGYAERMMDSHPTLIVHMVEHVARYWEQRDSGVWEWRDKEERFTSSKLLAWVAMDRGIELAKKFNMSSPIDDWRLIKDEIQSDILQSYNEKRGRFSISPDFEGLDSSLLLMSYYGLLAPDDEKFKSTVKAAITGF